MRISDWSSDVCSSDLDDIAVPRVTIGARVPVQRQRRLRIRIARVQVLLPALVGLLLRLRHRGGIRGHPVGLRRIQVGVEHAHRDRVERSEEHTSELQSLMRISYAVFCLKKKTTLRTKDDTNKQETNMKY